MEVHGLRSPMRRSAASFTLGAIQGGADEALFRWACTHGRQPSNKDVEIWNAFKRCWRDQYTSRLHVCLQEAGLPIGSVLTMFDFIDLDEGRPLPFRELELT